MVHMAPVSGVKTARFLTSNVHTTKIPKEGKWAYTGTVERVNDGAFLYEDQNNKHCLTFRDRDNRGCRFSAEQHRNN